MKGQIIKILYENIESSSDGGIDGIIESVDAIIELFIKSLSEIEDMAGSDEIVGQRFSEFIEKLKSE